MTDEEIIRIAELALEFQAKYVREEYFDAKDMVTYVRGKLRE